MAIDTIIRRVARLDKAVLDGIPERWTPPERGLFLRCLLHLKGIDCHRLYRAEYYPLPRCWVLIQEGELTSGRAPASLCVDEKANELFYRETMTLLRRTARSAWSVLARRSTHFARFGCKYDLPAKPQEVTPGELVEQLTETGQEPTAIHFTNEGGWYPDASPN